MKMLFCAEDIFIGCQSMSTRKLARFREELTFDGASCETCFIVLFADEADYREVAEYSFI